MDINDCAECASWQEYSVIMEQCVSCPQQNMFFSKQANQCIQCQSSNEYYNKDTEGCTACQYAN